jgi:hypothetical protein
MIITLCDKNFEGEIPQYEFENREQAEDAIYEWLYKKDFENSVFVCFPSFVTTENDDIRDEQNAFLISHSWDEISDFMENVFDTYHFTKFNFQIFEFETYQEAFDYCKDLKEGF